MTGDAPSGVREQGRSCRLQDAQDSPFGEGLQATFLVAQPEHAGDLRTGASGFLRFLAVAVEMLDAELKQAPPPDGIRGAWMGMESKVAMLAIS